LIVSNGVLVYVYKDIVSGNVRSTAIGQKALMHKGYGIIEAYL